MLNFTSKLGVFFISASLLTTSLPAQHIRAVETPILQTDSNTLTQPYIVGFHTQPDENLIEQLHGTINSRLSSIHALSVSLTNNAAQQLAQYPSVKFIEQDKQVVMEEQQIDS
jgi:hypothetical protein